MTEGQKKPKQSRSKKMVDDILEGTQILLEKIDFSKISTSKISEMTGVSVGSLYQYFLNREGVFASLIDKTLEKNRLKVREISGALPETDLSHYLDNLVDGLVDHFLTQKGYLKSLIFYQFQLSKADKIVESRWLMAEIITQNIVKRYGDVKDPAEIQKKIFVVITSAFGLVYLYSQVQNLPVSEAFIRDQIKAMSKSLIQNLN